MNPLAILRDPSTQTKLSQADEYLESKEGIRFPRNENLVNFLSTVHDNVATDEAASFRWDNSQRLEQDAGFTSHQLDDFLLRYGFESADVLKEWLKDVKTIAEIGAGEGRLVDWYLEYSEAIVYALELSDSVNYLRQKYADNNRVVIIKADALNHPFAEGSIDLVSCEQCIHHTDNPEEIFTSLCRSLSSKGKAILSVYAKKSPIREKFDVIIRDSIARLSSERKFELAKKITEMSKILSDMNVEVEVPESFTEFGDMAGQRSTLQRFFYYSIMKCFWNDDFTFEKSMEFNHDWYSYPICNKTSIEEGTQWFENNNLSIEHTDANPSNINLRGSMA